MAGRNKSGSEDICIGSAIGLGGQGNVLGDMMDKRKLGYRTPRWSAAVIAALAAIPAAFSVGRAISL